MYVANRAFKADGKTYRPGDPVPADTWKTKRALLSLGWIVVLPGIEEADKELAGTQNPPAGPPQGQEVKTQPPTEEELRQYVEQRKAEQAEREKEIDEAAAKLMKLSVSKLEEALKEVTNRDVLQAIIECDERKTVKEAAEARIKALDESKGE